MVQGLEIVKKTKPLDVVFFKLFTEVEIKAILFTIICNEMQL